MLEQESYYENIEGKRNRIQRIENQVRKKPDEKDIKETIRLFKDFGIKISRSEIPDCRSVCALSKWRVKKINEFLDSYGGCR